MARTRLQERLEKLATYTAPHHPDISSFPRHLHEGEKVSVDEITDTNLSAEENFRQFMNFIKKKF